MKSYCRTAMVVAGTGFMVTSAWATVFIALDTSINGPNVGSPPPFLTASISDTGLDTVQITMTNTMPSGHFVDNWVFNCTVAQPLTFSWVSGVVATSAVCVIDGVDGGSSVQAGLFDIEFHFPNDQNDPAKFDGGHTSVYTITGLGLTETAFMAVSIDDPLHAPSTGGWYSAGHVQGGGGSSVGALSAVPEPASLMALGLGFAALMRRRTIR